MTTFGQYTTSSLSKGIWRLSANIWTILAELLGTKGKLIQRHLSRISIIWVRGRAVAMELIGILTESPPWAMFVFWNSLFSKSLFKLSCVCLLLEKLINEKHFPVNGNTFRSTKNTFQSKKNLVWFPGKCFPFWLCLFSGKWFPGNHFPNFHVFVCH